MGVSSSRRVHIIQPKSVHMTALSSHPMTQTSSPAHHMQLSLPSCPTHKPNWLSQIPHLPTTCSFTAPADPAAAPGTHCPVHLRVHIIVFEMGGSQGQKDTVHLARQRKRHLSKHCLTQIACCAHLPTTWSFSRTSKSSSGTSHTLPSDTHSTRHHPAHWKSCAQLQPSLPTTHTPAPQAYNLLTCPRHAASTVPKGPAMALATHCPVPEQSCVQPGPSSSPVSAGWS